MYNLIIRDRAQLMLDEAYVWYEQKSPGLGERLLQEVIIGFKNLQYHPEYYTKSKDNYRQLILNSFPYKLVFEIIGTDVIVYSIFHTSRNPENLFE